ADPSDSAAVERVMKATGYQVIPGVAGGDAIVAVIRSIFPPGSNTASPPLPASSSRSDGSCARILARAVDRLASPVAIVEDGADRRIFYRIDGMLYLDRPRDGIDPAAAMTELREIAGLDREQATGVGRAIVTIERVDYQLLVRAKSGAGGVEICVKII